MTDLNTLITDLRARAEAASAEAAINSPWTIWLGAFREAANPFAILTILDALTEARGEVERLTDENDELRNVPWPEWAKKVVATIRAHSGYDGSDDAIDGIDMPQELGQILDEYDGQIKHKDAELATLRAEKDRLRRVCSEYNDEVSQILGKALGFPWFKDDQENFPGATEENGVCVGHFVAQDLANLAVNVIQKRDAEIATLRAEVEKLETAYYIWSQHHD